MKARKDCTQPLPLPLGNGERSAREWERFHREADKLRKRVRKAASK